MESGNEARLAAVRAQDAHLGALQARIVRDFGNTGRSADEELWTVTEEVGPPSHSLLTVIDLSSARLHSSKRSSVSVRPQSDHKAHDMLTSGPSRRARRLQPRRVSRASRSATSRRCCSAQPLTCTFVQ